MYDTKTGCQPSQNRPFSLRTGAPRLPADEGTPLLRTCAMHREQRAARRRHPAPHSLYGTGWRRGSPPGLMIPGTNGLLTLLVSATNGTSAAVTR
eukprot:3896723-Prymnesium_polylepis.1